MLSRRAFLTRLVVALPIAAAVRQFVPVPPSFKGIPFAWDSDLETLDVSRVDVFDKYEYSWKTIESAPVHIDGALAFKMRKIIEDLPRNMHETLFTSDA